MNNWLIGIASSLTASVIAVFAAFILRTSIIPRLRGIFLKTPDIEGSWEGYEPDSDWPDEKVSSLQIKQKGTKISASIVRRGKSGNERHFKYDGFITSGQLVLNFEEPDGAGYIVGAMVLVLSSNRQKLTGRTTYFHHDRNEVVSFSKLFLKSKIQQKT